jgi:hypothetical protein
MLSNPQQRKPQLNKPQNGNLRYPNQANWQNAGLFKAE